MSGNGKVAMIVGAGIARARALAMLREGYGAADLVLGRPLPEPATLR